MRLVDANHSPSIHGKVQLPSKVNYFIGNDPTRWQTNISTFAKVHYDGVYPGTDLVYYSNQEGRPVLNALYSVRPGMGRADNYSDFFVTKLTAGGKSIVYSIYFGGSAHDHVEGIAADPEGHAYIVCYTDSINLPIKDAFQPFFAGKTDMYYAKILPDGSGLVYGSYFGGSDWDGIGAVAGVALGPGGAFWIAGSCHSRGLATAGAFQTDFSIYPVSILAKFNAADGSLMAATYFDSTDTYSIAVDAAGDVWIGGSASEGVTLVNPIQPNYGGSGPDWVHAADGYVAKFSSDGSTLLFSTYFGGATGDGGISSVAVDPQGDILFVGAAYDSAGFPIINALQPTLRGTQDAFIAKISLAELLTISRSSQELVFTWPASATGYRLESTDTLGSEVNWQPLDTVLINNGTEWQVQLEIGSGSRFYRIAKP